MKPIKISDKDILELAVNIRRRLTTQAGWHPQMTTDFVDNAIMQEIKKHLK